MGQVELIHKKTRSNHLPLLSLYTGKEVKIKEISSMDSKMSIRWKWGDERVTLFVTSYPESCEITVDI
jgi:hypothetical protein